MNWLGGAYLTGVAACSECHTPLDGGMPDENEAFAGGNRYPMSGGIARASNITPHPESGIGRWSREQFIQRFRDAPTTSTNKIGAGSPNTVMPLERLCGHERRGPRSDLRVPAKPSPHRQKKLRIGLPRASTLPSRKALLASLRLTPQL